MFHIQLLYHSLLMTLTIRPVFVRFESCDENNRIKLRLDFLSGLHF